MSTAPTCEACGHLMEPGTGPSEWACPNRACNAEGIAVYTPQPINGDDGEIDPDEEPRR